MRLPARFHRRRIECADPGPGQISHHHGALEPQLGLDPARVVLAGGSTGGHLALLAAYAPHHPELTPADLRAADLSVRAAVSFYGAADMRAVYHHFGAHDSFLPVQVSRALHHKLVEARVP